MKKGPVRRKVPKGRPGGTVSAVRHAAANPRKKKVKTSSKGDYFHAATTKKAPKKKPGAIKRLVKFVKGDYTK